MGLTLATCNGCPLVPDCAIRRDKLRLLRGSGITYARFPCTDRRLGIEPGARVSVRLRSVEIVEGPWGDDTATYLDDYSGTAMAWRSGPTEHGWKPERLLVWLDEPSPEYARQMVTVNPSRLAKLDEPPVEVCPECGIPEGCSRSADHPYFCSVCEDGGTEARQAALASEMAAEGWS
jgi:hypothetical protein